MQNKQTSEIKKHKGSINLLQNCLFIAISVHWLLRKLNATEFNESLRNFLSVKESEIKTTMKMTLPLLSFLILVLKPTTHPTVPMLRMRYAISSSLGVTYSVVIWLMWDIVSRDSWVLKENFAYTE